MRFGIKIITVILLALFFGEGEVCAQDKKKVPTSFKMDFKLPNTMSNRAFDQVVDGISDVNISYQFPLYKNLTLGFGMKHAFYKIDDLAITELTNGKANTFAPFARLTYEKWVSERIFFDVGVNGGYSFMFYESETCESPHKISAPHIEPHAGIYMMSNENLGFGIIVAYNFILADFTPEYLCLDDFSGFSEADTKGISQTLSFGFGFTSIIGGKKKGGFDAPK
jgi:hypothetical protein